MLSDSHVLFSPHHPAVSRLPSLGESFLGLCIKLNFGLNYAVHSQGAGICNCRGKWTGNLRLCTYTEKNRKKRNEHL